MLVISADLIVAVAVHGRLLESLTRFDSAPAKVFARAKAEHAH